MPPKNVDLVRQAYAHWQAGDYDVLLDFFLEFSVPDVELHSRFAGLAGQPYRGHEGLGTWLSEIQEAFERFEPWIDEARPVDADRVVVVGGISFRARGSGVDMGERMGWVHEFRDGKLSRMLFYGDPAEALEEVGLGE
jgi:ketosteroid isomerase-like protein